MHLLHRIETRKWPSSFPSRSSICVFNCAFVYILNLYFWLFETRSHSSGCPLTHYVAESDHELLILLRYCKYRYRQAPLCLASRYVYSRMFCYHYHTHMFNIQYIVYLQLCQLCRGLSSCSLLCLSLRATLVYIGPLDAPNLTVSSSLSFRDIDIFENSCRIPHTLECCLFLLWLALYQTCWHHTLY